MEITGGKSLALIAAIGLFVGTAAAAPVDFNREIRPILAANCFACHGPDAAERQADLRLDTREGALANRDGHAALAPGKPEASELVRRISATDALERMPPADSGKKLSHEQIELVRRWVAEGAVWQEHWSYAKPSRPVVPATDAAAGAINPIDVFVRAKLASLGMTPSPEACRTALVRRLSFDLTGLPPTPEQVEMFLADTSPQAYENLVNRLLASPHYGERMAMYWLDVVRFADTNGYHGDNHRDIALFRDYAIQSFNRNKPFDRFTVEQLAGDLLPDASRETRIASGYNHLLITTREGSAQPKEYLAKYAADRVRNASSVWLGATMGCCECHDHKFDPFLTRDFYSFAAFFADIKEVAVGIQEQVMLPDEAESRELARLDAEIGRARQALEVVTPELLAAQAEWESSVQSQLAAWKPLVLSEFRAKFASQANPADARPLVLQEASADFSQELLPVAAAVDGNAQTGWAIAPHKGQPHVAVFEVQGAPAAAGSILSFEIVQRHGQSHNLGHFRISATSSPPPVRANQGLPKKILEILAVAPEARSTEQQQALAAHYRAIAPLLEPARKQLAAAEQAKAEFVKTVPTTLVATSVEPRTMRVLPRGNWLSDAGEVVAPAVPAFLTPLVAAGPRPTRLDLAHWMVSPDNPPVARVAVNRLWKIVFGQGIVKSLDDFGSQGTAPTHQELLDWLACEFVDSGWDVKHMLKLMVMSSTYRQSSESNESLRQLDPHNRWLARQSHYRLDAEMVRDNALAISGLLSSRIGGPSVKPYQPPGYWSHLNWPTRCASFARCTPKRSITIRPTRS